MPGRRNRLKGMRRRCAKLLARMARRAEELACTSSEPHSTASRQPLTSWTGAAAPAEDTPAALGYGDTAAVSAAGHHGAAISSAGGTGPDSPARKAVRPAQQGVLSAKAAAVVGKLTRIQRCLEKHQGSNNVTGVLTHQAFCPGSAAQAMPLHQPTSSNCSPLYPPHCHGSWWQSLVVLAADAHALATTRPPLQAWRRGCLIWVARWMLRVQQGPRRLAACGCLLCLRPGHPSRCPAGLTGMDVPSAPIYTAIVKYIEAWSLSRPVIVPASSFLLFGHWLISVHTGLRSLWLTCALRAPAAGWS